MSLPTFAYSIALGLGLVLVACGSDTAADAGTTSGSSGKPCRLKTCEDFQGACGLHEDGCGGKVSCGDCKPACTPKTCAELAKTCGTADDACGGTVNCGLCATTCPKDAKEPNDTKAAATDLGVMADSPNSTATVSALGSSDGDEDWFKAQVKDTGLPFTSPLVTATVTVGTLEVAVFHVCDSQPDFSSCSGAGAQDNSVGRGCRGTKTVALSTDCTGLNEDGTTYVRVRKLASDNACVSYDLTVKVE